MNRINVNKFKEKAVFETEFDGGVEAWTWREVFGKCLRIRSLPVMWQSISARNRREMLLLLSMVLLFESAIHVHSIHLRLKI